MYRYYYVLFQNGVGDSWTYFKDSLDVKGEGRAYKILDLDPASVTNEEIRSVWMVVFNQVLYFINIFSLNVLVCLFA